MGNCLLASGACSKASHAPLLANESTEGLVLVIMEHRDEQRCKRAGLPGALILRDAHGNTVEQRIKSIWDVIVCACCCPALQYTLYHLFGYSYGNSTFVLWKMAGAADIALMPAILLALKVCSHRQRIMLLCFRSLHPVYCPHLGKRVATQPFHDAKCRELVVDGTP